MPTRTAPVVTLTSPKKTEVQSLAIVGLGYVGLPLALCAEQHNLTVFGFDLDIHKIRALSKREAPHLSEKERRLLKKSTMEVTDDERILENLDAYIICVPTPVDEAYEPDLTPLIAASESVGRHIAPGALIVVESTVNPGACENVIIPIIERESGLRHEQDFFFAHCPERINPGDTTWDVGSIPRVLGAVGPESLERALDLYQTFISAPIEPMASLKEAEAVKMVENSFRDVNIAFVNELAMSFSRAGIDITNVIRGASTKPFAFMPHFPSCGVGGHCIPVDPYYLIRYGRENGFEHQFLAAARNINNTMPAYTVELLETALKNEHDLPLAGATVALLGLAYKRQVPDIRESPALKIQEELIRRGAAVQSFDPFIPEKSSSASLLSALSGSDAAIIATDHDVFRALTPEVFSSQNVRVVVDGKNCLPKETFLATGLTYRGIGR